MKAIYVKMVLLTCIVWTVVFPDESVDTFSTLDGFTSATIYHSLKIYTSKIYKDQAVFQWWDEWDLTDTNIKEYKLLWGTEDGIYTNERNLLPHTDTVVTPIVIDNLEPGTKYFARFLRNYQHDEYITNFVFTTLPLKQILPTYDASTAVSISFSKPRYAPRKSDNIATVELTAIDGKQISRIPFTTFENTKIAIRTTKIVPGLYIATFRNVKNTPVSSMKFFIN